MCRIAAAAFKPAAFKQFSGRLHSLSQFPPNGSLLGRVREFLRMRRARN